MNPNVLNGFKRVQRRLLGFCWIWFFLFVFFVVTSILDNVNVAISATITGIFFVICFLLHSIVKSFVCGVEGKED